MDDAGGASLRWDSGQRRWPRKRGMDVPVIAANAGALLVRVRLRPGLDIGTRVGVELAGVRSVVEIRHVAPTGAADGTALVGVEFVRPDEQIVRHLASLFPEGESADRWWWQSPR